MPKVRPRPPKFESSVLSPGAWCPGEVYHTTGVKEMITRTNSKSFNLSPAKPLQGHHTNPQSVLRAATMTVKEKRSLLASWASDARAVPDHPGVRRLDDGRILELDDILDALKQLGEFPSSTRSTKQSHRSYRLRRWATLSRIFRRGDNDDDDPTSPAPIAPRPRPPVFYDTRQLAAA